MSFEWINETVARTPIRLWILSQYGYGGVGMAQVGSEWPKWGRNGPSALRMHLMYLFGAQAVGNCYCILEG